MDENDKKIKVKLKLVPRVLSSLSHFMLSTTNVAAEFFINRFSDYNRCQIGWVNLIISDDR